MFKQTLKLAVMSATALSSVISSPAWADATETPIADPANATTIAAMAAQCEAIRLTYVASATNPLDQWTATVVEGDVTLTNGPTETGNRVKDMSTVTPLGDLVPSVKEIRGEPFRVGGSVNMFGEQWMTAGYYPDSTYEYTADFHSEFSHAFDCEIYQAAYHEASVPGHYDNPGNGDCNGITPDHQFWGQNIGACTFVPDGDPISAGVGDPELADTVAGVPVPQGQDDNLDGFEAHGGILNVSGEMRLGHAVVCISPSKPTPGGTWRNQNGYPGSNCTTAYFKTAPWGSGSQTSQGTFISVPNYTYP